ncbi:MAG: intradiol ring-cleavage dioxygenase [Candidatus Acidiferrum sp.]
MELNRRDLIAKCVAMGVVTLASNLNVAEAAEAWSQTEKKSRAATPSADFGPFYKRDAPNTAMLRAPNDPGLALAVGGAVFNTRGDSLPGAKIEVWQTDHTGHYDLRGYRYRAALLADSGGNYSFGSVMPGHYPVRVCQHIHFAVTAAGHKPLVTQMYFSTDPVFEGDPDKNFTKDPLCSSRELVRPVVLKGDPAAIVANSNFELVLERL